MRSLGVTPNTEWGIATSRNIPYHVFVEQQAQIEQMNERMKQQDERYEHILSILEAQQGSANNITRVQSSSSQNLPRSNNGSRPLTVHSSIFLKSMADQKTIVARGYLVSMDPSRDVGRTHLGRNMCEVNVQSVEVRSEPLIRPFSDLETLDDVEGIAIAWPITFVSRDEDD